jgi:hypothetical protein
MLAKAFAIDLKQLLQIAREMPCSAAIWWIDRLGSDRRISIGLENRSSKAARRPPRRPSPWAAHCRAGGGDQFGQRQFEGRIWSG